MAELKSKPTLISRIIKVGQTEIEIPNAASFGDIAIPEEIKDIEEYCKPSSYNVIPKDKVAKYKMFVKALLKICKPGITQEIFNEHTKTMQKRFKVTPKKVHLLQLYRLLLSDKENTITVNTVFEDFVRKKKMKSNSGIVSITTVMKADEHSCDMDCHYCPNDPAVSRSYLLDEPAVNRAFKLKWDAFLQFAFRYDTLYCCGHTVTKVEVIVRGGTFGNYSKEYCVEFTRDTYYAANIIDGIIDDAPEAIHELHKRMGNPLTRLSLKEEIMINKYANCAIIGLTIETRPDWINKRQIKLFRELGVTRVELGVQHLNESILNKVNRQCPNWKTIKGIFLLRQNGFKVDLHFMPDLPGSSYKLDLAMFKFLFSSDNEDFQGDDLKIYPCMVLIYTKIKEWHENGSYKPYANVNDGVDLFNLLIYICTHVNPWIRLNRMIRDMPNPYISGGVDKLNLRQDLQNYMKENNLIGTDIRAREVGNGEFDPTTAKIFINTYRASKGTEYYISFEDSDQRTLYGFVRLRLSDDPNEKVFFNALKNSAFIRELHVYGDLMHQTESTGHKVQHRGIGKLLVAIAEKIAFNNGWTKMAIISGVGVRRYYEGRGYHEEDTYMVKELLTESLVQPPKHFLHHYDYDKIGLVDYIKTLFKF